MAMRAPWLHAVLISWCFLFDGHAAEDFPGLSPLVTKESRRSLVSTESGVITAVDVHDGRRGPYHLQFITLEPSSLFLPVLLHTDMVFYVHTGRGSVNWVNEDGKDGLNRLEVERGDIYRLEQGSVFYVQSHPDPTREKLRIHSIFNTINNENIPQEIFVGAYSNVSDLVRGFDDKVLQMGFGVSEEAVHAIKWAEKPPPIVHFAPNKTDRPNWNVLLEALVGGSNPIGLINGKKKTKTKAFNVFRESPDVENCNGWSLSVTDRRLRALKGSDIGVFMVNLTKGSMVAPHWNPKATEVAIVIHGHGIVHVVCPSNPSGDQSDGDPFKCDNMKFRVKEGDVFIVPRFHLMAQMSFNDDSLVFMGFSTSVKNNRPQFLAGKWSVLRTIDKEILAKSFATSNTTIEELLSSQDEAVMLECTSCAEEVEQKMEEEMGRKRQEEEARKREEEEAKRKQEEEEARRRQEEARKREEEEAKRREEETRRREEEEEEEARREQEEEARRKREEEETTKREEEARKEEEEAKRREEEEEEARREEEEEARRREEEARKREEEETRESEEEARKEEEEAKRREEEEEARKGEEEEARRREEEEDVRKREEEEAKRKEEDDARKREEEASREEEEARSEEGKDETQQKEREKEAQKEQIAARREEEAKQKQIKEEEVMMQEKEQEGEEAPNRRRGDDKILEGKVLSRRMWRV